MPSEDQILRQQMANAMANIQSAFTDQVSRDGTIKVEMDRNWRVKTFENRVIMKKGPRKFTQKMMVELIRSRPDLIEDFTTLTNGLRGSLGGANPGPSGLNIFHTGKFIRVDIGGGKPPVPGPNPNVGRGIHMMLPPAWTDKTNGLLTKLHRALTNKRNLFHIKDIPGGISKAQNLALNLERLLEDTGSSTIQPEGIDPLKAKKTEVNYLRQRQQEGKYVDVLKKKVQPKIKPLPPIPRLHKKTIIAGGRGFVDAELMAKEMKNVPWSIGEVVSGTAKGADRLGEGWAKEQKIPVRKFKPNWDLFGRTAGKIRNTEMAKHADALVAFWDGESTGTKHMIDEARAKGLDVKVIKIPAPETGFDKSGVIQVGNRATDSQVKMLLNKDLLKDSIYTHPMTGKTTFTPKEQMGKYLTKAEAAAMIQADIDKGIQAASMKRVSTPDPVTEQITTKTSKGKPTRIGDVIPEATQKGKPLPFGYSHFERMGHGWQIPVKPKFAYDSPVPSPGVGGKQFGNVRIPSGPHQSILGITNYINEKTGEIGAKAINATEVTESFVKAKSQPLLRTKPTAYSTNIFMPGVSDFMKERFVNEKRSLPWLMSKVARSGKFPTLPLIFIPLLLAGLFGNMNKNPELTVS